MTEHIGEEFQERTKYVRETMRPMELDFAKKPETFKRYPDAETVELPLPMDVPPMELWRALAERRSKRKYSGGSMTLMQLSQLMWASQGVTARKGEYLLRAAPSAGALYPVETYVVINNVTASPSPAKEEAAPPSPLPSPPAGGRGGEEETTSPSPFPSPSEGRGGEEETTSPSPFPSPSEGRGDEETDGNASGKGEFDWPAEETANDANRVPPGVYHYDVQNHRLECVKTGDFSRDVASAALDQVMCVNANVVFLWTAVFERSKWKYGQRAYRYVYLDAGHIAAHVALAAVALGLGSCQIAALFDDECNRIVGVDGTRESTIYMTSVGNVRT